MSALSALRNTWRLGSLFLYHPKLTARAVRSERGVRNMVATAATAAASAERNLKDPQLGARLRAYSGLDVERMLVSITGSDPSQLAALLNGYSLPDDGKVDIIKSLTPQYAAFVFTHPLFTVDAIARLLHADEIPIDHVASILRQNALGDEVAPFQPGLSYHQVYQRSVDRAAEILNSVIMGTDRAAKILVSIFAQVDQLRAYQTATGTIVVTRALDILQSSKLSGDCAALMVSSEAIDDIDALLLICPVVHRESKRFFQGTLPPRASTILANRFMDPVRREGIRRCLGTELPPDRPVA